MSLEQNLLEFHVWSIMGNVGEERDSDLTGPFSRFFLFFCEKTLLKFGLYENSSISHELCDGETP